MNGNSNYREIFDLFKDLQRNLIGSQKREALKHVAEYISCNNPMNQNLPFDESTLVSKISSHLSITKSQNEATQFLDYYEKLSTCLEPRNRIAVLTFLMYMADSNANATASAAIAGVRFCSDDLKIGRTISSNTFLESASIAASKATMYNNMFNTAGGSGTLQFEQIYPLTSTKTSVSASSSTTDNFLKLTSIKPYSAGGADVNSLNSNEFSSTGHIIYEQTEDLVQEVIYAFTGIQGKYLKKDIISGGFKLDPKARSLSVTNAGMLLRLAELGYYHDQVRSFTDTKTGRTALGLLGQGLITSLKCELTHYYGMVALLQEQLNRQRAGNINNVADQLTLLKAMLWAVGPLHRLQWLTTIAESCQEKKGGALVTAIAAYQNNGDPMVKTIVNELLLAACRPLLHMLSIWLTEGELVDPHSEFFIEILPDVGIDRLWNEKYRVREAMLPKFISSDLATKILVTGKSINFLREVCQDKIPIKSKDDLKQCFHTNGQDIFALVPDTKLHLLIDTVYLNASKRVVDIAMREHKLLKHLQAMRNYLLLGQGDFIGILMENLKPELDRPAKELYSYELSSIVESAIRSTNAQFDDQEILSQLDVKIMGNFEGDIGWDIFSLNYTVQGPLSTMLQPSMNDYQLIFKSLWKMKHLEFVLSRKIWKNQISNDKVLKPIRKEIYPITHRLHLYTTQMIHFINQIQYYILFEVIECLWSNMLDKVQQAKTLDDILEAHEEFLREVKIGLFMENKNEILSELTRVFTAIVKLEFWQEKFDEDCYKHFNARRAIIENIEESAKKGEYGLTKEVILQRDEDKRVFISALKCHEENLNKICNEFEDAARSFLLCLAKDNDNNLQLLCSRIDFNEFYKNRDHRLDAPLMFANLRQSSIMFPTAARNNSRNNSRFNMNN